MSISHPPQLTHGTRFNSYHKALKGTVTYTCHDSRPFEKMSSPLFVSIDFDGMKVDFNKVQVWYKKETAAGSIQSVFMTWEEAIKSTGIDWNWIKEQIDTDLSCYDSPYGRCFLNKDDFGEGRQ
jgi:hypothetical protein